MSATGLVPSQLGEATALVSIVGFAIQQALQMLDSFVSALIDWLKAKEPAGNLPGHLTDVDFKKSVMALLSFFVGLGTVLALPALQLLQYVGIKDSGLRTRILDILISALVFGAGTEGANTALKYFGYVKDARKKPVIVLDVVPKTVTVSKGGTVQFLVSAKDGGESSAEWRILTGGGNISPAGLYTAPETAGTYQVAAVSTVDLSAVAIATVTVT